LVDPERSQPCDNKQVLEFTLFFCPPLQLKLPIVSSHCCRRRSPTLCPMRSSALLFSSLSAPSLVRGTPRALRNASNLPPTSDPSLLVNYHILTHILSAPQPDRVCQGPDFFARALDP
jgi:hypothetical protein